MLTPIKLARLQKGLRQWDLCRELGISESYFSRIETGKVRPSDQQAKRIAELLDCPIGIVTEILSDNRSTEQLITQTAE